LRQIVPRSLYLNSKRGATRTVAIVAVLAIIAIAAYSSLTIDRFVISNQITIVPFNLGTADRNVPYCNGQTLDIYVPNSTDTRPKPVAIYVHGGSLQLGLSSGDKSDLKPVFLNALATAGYVVASINYRLAPQYKYPSQIEDVKCAVRYLRSNAQTYGINGSEVFAFGDSSGGQLVSLAALTGSYAPFNLGPYSNQPSGITAAADFFGETNFTELGISSSDFQQVYGNESNLALASPINFVSASSAPILIIQGVEDNIVPESQSVQLYSALHANGAQTQLILVQNAGHELIQVGSQPISPSISTIADDMVSFFSNYTGIG
jgi:acetyl esterase/lipase